MTLDSLCNTCNKSVTYRKSTEFKLFLTQTPFKCSNLNFFDSHLIKDSNKFSGFCLLPQFLTIYRSSPLLLKNFPARLLVNVMFMTGTGLNLNKKILFLTIF